jgi:hypothetical protein
VETPISYKKLKDYPASGRALPMRSGGSGCSHSLTFPPPISSSNKLLTSLTEAFENIDGMRLFPMARNGTADHASFFVTNAMDLHPMSKQKL